ncbi:pentatricopeptide repeat-containing protein At4g35850, mitochondrial-like [Solanum verrucosum]|uniref:pentatricopeptide repeat-containing protein At4g35850, mitochondrial-like n=1 Tax=Solanum verrucosum TaxID=315347 RepID=UPI0020D05B36|nr:pentatricopeptide repeat-containing protein At4g35850, mitochondrial-like [Solanum verrucosum]
MKLLRTLSGPKNLFVQSIGHRYFAATPEEYANRNYANNESEYTTVINSITAQRKNFLLSNLFNPIERGGKVFVSPDYNQSKEQQREISP